MAKQPKIRFKGFTEEWEETPLSEYLMVSNERNDNDRYTAQDIQSVSGEYGVVNQIEFQGRSFAGASLLNYRVIHNGEIAYTKSPLKLSPYGIIKANKSVTGIVSALYGVYKVKKGDPNFIQDYFDLLARLNGYLRPLVNKGAKNTLLITDEDAISGNVVFPKTDEQKAISNLISHISTTILRRETELEKLKNIKRALLEKLFPQDGQSTPAIRFKGFEDKWEPTMLGQKIKEINRKNANSTVPIMMIAAGNGFIYQSDRYSFNNAGKSLQQYIVLNRNELAYNHGASKLHPYGCCYALLSEGSARIPYVYHCFSTTCCPEFLSTILNEREAEYQLRKLISSGARMDGLLNISFEAYSSISLKLPKTPEQEKIAKLVNSLNKTISLRERQLTLLKHSKQALLEQMFVNE